MTRPPRKRSRAIWDDEKVSRRGEIIDAAARLYARGDLQDISVQAVCAEAGLAKGTFYLYFATKESVFLALHARLIDFWAADLTQRLATLSAGAPPDELARAVIGAFRRDVLLLRLLPLLHGILEVNVTADEIKTYKLALFEHQERHVAEVARILPRLSLDACAFFLVTCHTMLVATWQLATPPPNVRTALVEAGLSQWVFAFDPLATRQIVTLLAGLASTEGVS